MLCRGAARAHAATAVPGQLLGTARFRRRGMAGLFDPLWRSHHVEGCALAALALSALVDGLAGLGLAAKERRKAAEPRGEESPAGHLASVMGDARRFLQRGELCGSEVRPQPRAGPMSRRLRNQPPQPLRQVWPLRRLRRGATCGSVWANKAALLDTFDLSAFLVAIDRGASSHSQSAHSH